MPFKRSIAFLSQKRMPRSRRTDIHSVEELDYVDDGGVLQLGAFRFSNATLPQHLLKERGVRGDLPKLD